MGENGWSGDCEMVCGGDWGNGSGSGWGWSEMGRNVRVRVLLSFLAIISFHCSHRKLNWKAVWDPPYSFFT